MTGDRLKTNILSTKIIPNADRDYLDALGADDTIRSLGIITTDCDDVSYTALDESTKKANVKVIYAQSMYAGFSNSSTALAGEFIGIIGGPDPEQVRSGLDCCVDFINNDAFFYSANEDDTISYFAHCISRSGSYLSEMASVNEGVSIAYLIAPPLEAVCAIDDALKASDVQLKVFFEPPSNTNFAGALLVGEQSACKSACEAFANRVCEIAQNPLSY